MEPKRGNSSPRPMQPALHVAHYAEDATLLFESGNRALTTANTAVMAVNTAMHTLHHLVQETTQMALGITDAVCQKRTNGPRVHETVYVESSTVPKDCELVPSNPKVDPETSHEDPIGSSAKSDTCLLLEFGNNALKTVDTAVSAVNHAVDTLNQLVDKTTDIMSTVTSAYQERSETLLPQQARDNQAQYLSSHMADSESDKDEVYHRDRLCHMYPPGWVDGDMAEKCIAIKFLRSRLVELGAHPDSEFGEMLDEVGYLDRRLRRKLLHLQSIRHDMDQNPRVNSFRQAGTTRLEFLKLAEKAGRALNAIIEDRHGKDELCRHSRKRSRSPFGQRSAKWRRTSY